MYNKDKTKKLVQVPVDVNVYAVMLEIKEISGISVARQISDSVNANLATFEGMRDALKFAVEGNKEDAEQALSGALGKAILNIIKHG